MMEITAFDGDTILTNYLTDYIDGNLDETECEVFEDYLSQNKKEKEFARKALKGKKALSRLAGEIKDPAQFCADLNLQTTIKDAREDRADLVK